MDENQRNNALGIRKSVKMYYSLPPKVLIEHHDELIFLFRINGSIHQNHPQKGLKVYISRRALKHFVERRKEELSKKHSDIQSMRKIFFIINHLRECISNFDYYEFNQPNRNFYDKTYLLSPKRKHTLRILAETKENRIELISIHLRKN